MPTGTCASRRRSTGAPCCSRATSCSPAVEWRCSRRRTATWPSSRRACDGWRRCDRTCCCLATRPLVLDNAREHLDAAVAALDLQQLPPAAAAMTVIGITGVGSDRRASRARVQRAGRRHGRCSTTPSPRSEQLHDRARAAVRGLPGARGPARSWAGRPGRRVARTSSTRAAALAACRREVAVLLREADGGHDRRRATDRPCGDRQRHARAHGLCPAARAVHAAGARHCSRGGAIGVPVSFQVMLGAYETLQVARSRFDRDCLRDAVSRLQPRVGLPAVAARPGQRRVRHGPNRWQARAGPGPEHRRRRATPHRRHHGHRPSGLRPVTGEPQVHHRRRPGHPRGGRAFRAAAGALGPDYGVRGPRRDLPRAKGRSVPGAGRTFRSRR